MRSLVLACLLTGCGGALAESNVETIAASDLGCKDVRVVDVGSNRAHASGCSREADYHYGMNDHAWHVEKKERDYELRQGKILVVDEEGERTIDVPCQAQSLARTNDRIEIACSDAKIAVFSLVDPARPAFVELHWTPPPAIAPMSKSRENRVLLATGIGLAASSVAMIIGSLAWSLAQCPLVSFSPCHGDGAPAALGLAGVGGLATGIVLAVIGAK